MSPTLSNIPLLGFWIVYNFSFFRPQRGRCSPELPARYLARFFFIFITTLRTGAETITTVGVAFGSYVLPSGCVRPTSRFTELCELALILTCSVEQVNACTFYLIRGIDNFAINALMSV